MRIRVVSWNVAGGHKVASLEHFDYQSEDISYFSDQIKRALPDVVCLQESHTNKDSSKSTASDIATSLGMKVVINSPNSPSHIDANYLLGTAMLSSFPAKSALEKAYPNPEGQLYWSDGRPADTHEKSLELVSFDQFNIANNQMLPIKLFGFAYDDGGKGSDLARKINSVMSEIVRPPVIWCGDFNFYEPLEIYPYFKGLNLTEALPDKTTRPSKDGSKRKQDHILYSPEFKLISSDVITTDTDHYLCFAELEI